MCLPGVLNTREVTHIITHTHKHLCASDQTEANNQDSYEHATYLGCRKLRQKIHFISHGIWKPKKHKSVGAATSPHITFHPPDRRADCWCHKWQDFLPVSDRITLHRMYLPKLRHSFIPLWKLGWVLHLSYFWISTVLWWICSGLISWSYWPVLDMNSKTERVNNGTAQFLIFCRTSMLFSMMALLSLITIYRVEGFNPLFNILTNICSHSHCSS